MLLLQSIYDKQVFWQEYYLKKENKDKLCKQLFYSEQVAK